ncbi:MAG: type II toxin-antitoxin system prevent-host-death family antitoxin [Microbacteriaceae bacterium]|nr:type II toxin-antitoxin system prevent-host-death family antitoxin [Microbacteriaceae bacterium]
MQSQYQDEESLSQRELRNESGKVLRAVSQGQSFIVTNSGIAVGKLVPLDTPPQSLKISKVAARKGGWLALGVQPKKTKTALSDIIDELREDRT